ncbi:MAG: right-handed parallel beta-helix repeat-containing protein [Phycisphaerales bacterium]
MTGLAIAFSAAVSLFPLQPQNAPPRQPQPGASQPTNPRQERYLPPPPPPTTPPGTVMRAPNPDLPLLVVTNDDTPVTQSCRISIPPGTVIADSNNNGVLRITSPNITIEFDAGSILRGSPTGADPDTYAGVGIRIENAGNVTIRNAAISGFKAGIHATKAANLTIEESTLSDNFRQRLRSTPDAEDSSDWLWPHRNDHNEHLVNYGAAIYIEDSHHVTVRKCLVHNGQNSLYLDRVNDSRIFDNDFSFNSGWGIFLYRSSGNVVTRNACDFNIRGYSHGVYNRGQDSAGILLFEQSSNNTIADNSATHCGDGVFAFAGIEALGEDWYNAEADRLRRQAGSADSAVAVSVPKDVVDRHRRLGCNNNVFLKNDLSWAAAHGLELTFSFNNTIVSNLIRHNAICGVWAGYSQDTLIGGNNFTSNGLPGTPTDGSTEGGGINIEHGSGNRLLGNKFIANPVAIRLWDDDDAALLRFPWALANHKGSSGNILKANMFDGDSLGIRLIRTTGTRLSINTFKNVPPDRQFIKDDASEATEEKMMVSDGFQNPSVTILGDTKPFNGRPTLHGRENIVMTQWGPWDHESPIVRPGRRPSQPGSDSHEFFGLPSPGPKATVVSGDVDASFVPGSVNPYTLIVSPKGSAGVAPYTVRVTSGAYSADVSGTLINARWNVTFFPTPDYGAGTAPPDLDQWRALAHSPEARSVTTGSLSMRFGYTGPASLGLAPGSDQWPIASDHFGTIAKATLSLTPGTYRVKTLSDDGVRVIVGGKTLVERWDWHSPQADSAELTIDSPTDVAFIVEHFEIDGYAVLDFSIEAVR